jgi:hypothetical protein
MAFTLILYVFKKYLHKHNMKNNDDSGNITAAGTPIDNKEKPKKTLRVYQNLNEEEAKVTESS